MVTHTEEEIDADWLRTVTDRYNPHVIPSDNPVANFEFKRPEWGLCATAYSSAYLLLNDHQMLNFQEPSMDGIGNKEVLSISQQEKPESYVHARAYTPDWYERVVGLTPSGVSQLRSEFPDLFGDTKYLAFVDDGRSETEMQELVDKIRDQGDTPEQYVIYPIQKSNKYTPYLAPSRLVPSQAWTR